MDKKIIAFGDAVIEKHKFLCHKNSILLDHVYIYKIIVCNQVSFGKKSFIYFIGYKDNETVKPMCIMLLKISG